MINSKVKVVKSCLVSSEQAFIKSAKKIQKKKRRKKVREMLGEW